MMTRLLCLRLGMGGYELRCDDLNGDECVNMGFLGCF